ncbi:MAG: AAA family ATPase, partial [Candidatus Rokubacteria bacterium]|nr:AAA family ATPase [Candidatus Rokubacteria bacterium]
MSATFTCPTCQAENPATNKFCGECGGRLPAASVACSHHNPVGQKFCGECGAALSVAALGSQAALVPAALEREPAPTAYTPKHLAEKILRSRSAVEGERKLVTVMFSDVSGFTAMSERLDPEEVHAIMDRAFDVIINAVHRYEGTINQFLGDGVMALFGAPIAHEDHPHRAIRAALAIQDGLTPLKREVRQAHGVKFRVRMGINTGLVFVGAIGKDLRMDYTAVGDTTNLAARLLSHAGPGQIVVSAQTQRFTDGCFRFEDLGEFQVKGKAEPVRAYEVKSEIRGRTRLEVSKERGLTPLVGRESELSRLADAYARADEGRGAVVLLSGEPGVGKSRLLYEFLQSLEGRPALELEGNCLPYTRSVPYHPILELMRRYLGFSEAVRPEEIRTRVADQLQSLGLSGEEPAILLGHFLGVPAPEEFLIRFAGAQLKERTFNVLREMLFRASTAEPLVLVVENVHWADTSSEEFLGYLMQGLPGRRMLLLMSARPGLTGAWLVLPLIEAIVVGGLDPGDVHAMVRTLLGAEAVSESLLQLLVDKGEGNPLYVEEILQQLRETAGLVIEHGEARLSAADVKVPATIQDIIAARIDRLADPVKHALQVAAVVGRQFAVSLLSRVLETDGELARYLSDLQGGDFIFPAARDPELVYSFKHALT